jgi:hypothetical protein
MSSLIHSRTAAWAALAAILITGAALVIAAPAEQTLGQAVKIVYVHVALSRAGAIGITLAGLLGLTVLVTASKRLAGWMRSLGWAALGLFAAGFAVSIVAQAASWGGIAWREPRVSSALNILAAAAIVQVLDSWLPWAKARGAARLALAVFQVWADGQVSDVLHPAGSAISSSPSSAIQLTGVALLALALALGVWIVWQIRTRWAAPSPAGA